MVTHKTCTRCKEEKPLEAFSPSKTGKHGRRSHCKECRSVPHLQKRRKLEKLCVDQTGRKLCMGCEECKPVEEFSHSSKNSDGRSSYCTQCRSAYYYENHKHENERNSAYYRERSEEIRAYRRNYYQDNKQHELQRNRRYYKENRVAIRKVSSRYRRLKPFVKRAAEQRRLARKRDLPNTFTAEDWQRALDYFDHRCAVCGYEPDEHRILAMDHWIPLASPDCPGTVPENIVPLCHGLGGCNNEKVEKLPLAWLWWKYSESVAEEKLVNITHYFLSLT